VSRVLSVSLGARPRGKLVIQDNAKLDLVEELIHHTLLAGRTSEAWDIHWCVADELRVWQDFGTFERGLRICRDFLRTCPNDRQMVPGLSAACHAALIHATGICLSQLGRVAESREYFKRFVECGACNHGLSGIYNLAYGFVCTGHLRDAHELMDNGREMVRDSEDPADEGSFVSLLASINGLRGRVEQAVAEFCWSIKQPYTVAQAEDVFHCERLIAFAQIQACLGRRKNALESICRARGEMTSVANQVMLPDCNLLLAEISRESQNHASARALLNECQNWALARESTEVACRIALVEARILINTPDLAERLLTTNTVITRGLKIARDCGYGLYHIDLLLERARLHLLRGDAGAALDDIEVALDTGIPANEETGQVELLSANHEECGYAWAIPVGLQLRAEALLLQAAQGVISVGWAVPTDGSLPPIDLTAMGRAHTTIQQLIDNAEQFLHEALDRWHDLRDPEPTEDNNFVHPETGKEYNYKAEATYKVLVDLEADILTQYPLELFKDKTDQPSVEEELPMTATPSPRVFISYTHDSEGHANNVLQLANRLRNDGIEAHIDQYVQNPSEGWPLWMDNEIEVADFVLVVFTERYAAKAKEAKRSGGRFESVLILQDLYEGGMSNNKFIPVVLCGSDTSFILKWLKSVNRYLVDSDQGYESLRRRLLNDPAIVPPPVGTPVKKGPTNP
jgi:tetratricopeptide (TPR) repeat protein